MRRTSLVILVAAVVAVGCGESPLDPPGPDWGATPDGGPVPGYGEPCSSGYGSGLSCADGGGAGPTPDAGPPPPPCNEHTFTYVDETATTVWVTGSFTDWAETPSAGAIELTADGSGTWSVTLWSSPLASISTSWSSTARAGSPTRSTPTRSTTRFGATNSVITLCFTSCGDPDEYDWRDAVMYFAMVDRFRDSDGRADTVGGASGGDASRGPSGQYAGGDIRGVTDELEYLANLGVTSLWLSAPYENRNSAGAAIDPFSDSHTYSAYHGYWPSPADIDYSAAGGPSPRPRVESRIGSEADLHELVDSAHGTMGADGHGMKVLFDYVMNHVDVESGLYGAHPDWFARRDGRFPLCGPEGLWDDAYWGVRCAFTDYLPAFDFDNAEARAWSVSDALWWAQEFELDGYRLDAIKHVPLSWLMDLRGRLNAEVERPAGDRFYLVGETFSYDDPGLLRSFVDPDTMLDGQFDFPFKARACEALFLPEGRLDNLASWMDDNDRFYGPGAIMTTWIGNHDIPRAIHFASGEISNCREGSNPGNGWDWRPPQPGDPAAYERLGLAFAVMFTSPGIPLIYYGDGIGLAGGGDPDNRRMMEWDDAALSPAQRSLRERIGALARARAVNKVLSRGRRTTLHADQDTWVYRMTGCGGDIPDAIVAMNSADTSRTVEIPPGTWVDLLNDAPVSAGRADLEPRSFLLLGAP